MISSIYIYHCTNKYIVPIQTEISVFQTIDISENEYIYIELFSAVPLGNSDFLWLSDFKFSLLYNRKVDLDFVYSVNLSTFFDSGDIEKFSFQYNFGDFSTTLYKVFLNYYGECSLELEGLLETSNIILLGKINVESDKILEVDSLLNYLLQKNHYYWNAISLTKIQAVDTPREDENIIWTLKKIDLHLDTFGEKVIPYLSDSIGRLTPKYDIENFNDTSVITEESISWLLANCNVLEPNGNDQDNSFLILNKRFKVQELLVQTLALDTDVTENQIIHGYISDISVFLNSSFLVIEKLLIDLEFYTDFKAQIFKSYYRRLMARIIDLQSKIENIKELISRIVPVKREHLNLLLSDRFQSKQHYYEAYLLVSNWIVRNDVIFSDKELFSGAKDISKLYEVCCLFKIIDTLTNDFGYKIYSSADIQTEKGVMVENWFGRNSNLKSKYVFVNSDDSHRINLFYERLPESLTTVAKGISRGYKPDFILELEGDVGNSMYIILDAKYKRIGTIQNFDYQELTFKYLHGIGNKSGGNMQVLGLFVLNPIENGGISYYQKNEFSQVSGSASLPLIGRIEISTSLGHHNYLVDVMKHLFAIASS